MTRPVRIGIGGPVGSGKTALLEVLCREIREQYRIASSRMTFTLLKIS